MYRECGWEVQGEEFGTMGPTKQEQYDQEWMAGERQESQGIEKREEKGFSQRRSDTRCENSMPRNGQG